MGDVLLALLLAGLVFGCAIRGNLLLLLTLFGLYSVWGIACGIMLATVLPLPGRQVMLTAFFITPADDSDSGAIAADREHAGPSFQVLSLASNPFAHFIAIPARLDAQGVGLEALLAPCLGPAGDGAAVDAISGRAFAANLS